MTQTIMSFFYIFVYLLTLTYVKSEVLCHKLTKKECMDIH